MVPGSTLMYGSNFCRRTRRPRRSRSMPIEALVSPLPSELTTPPVTKMCLGMKRCPLSEREKPTGLARGLRFPHASYYARWPRTGQGLPGERKARPTARAGKTCPSGRFGEHLSTKHPVRVCGPFSGRTELPSVRGSWPGRMATPSYQKCLTTLTTCLVPNRRRSFPPGRTERPAGGSPCRLRCGPSGTHPPSAQALSRVTLAPPEGRCVPQCHRASAGERLRPALDRLRLPWTHCSLDTAQEHFPRLGSGLVGRIADPSYQEMLHQGCKRF